MKKVINLFWIVWGVSLLLGLVGAFYSSKYLFEKLGIDMKVVFIFTALLTFIVLLFRFIKKDFVLQKRDRIITIFSAFVVLVYFVLKVINRLVFNGLIFDKLHVLPKNLFWLALICLLSIAVVWIPQIKFKKLLNIQSVIFLIILLMIFYNLFSIYKSKWRLYQQIITNPYASYDDKMRNTIGDLIYNYALFVDKYTPEEASILVPPQAFPWPGTGNVGYFRYFVYPRTINSGDEFELPSKDDLNKIDYVLLNWGETDRVENLHTHGWPKFDVKAEKIIFMNRNGSYGGEIKGNYYYKDYKDKQVWGIIVVKH